MNGNDKRKNEETAVQAELGTGRRKIRKCLHLAATAGVVAMALALSLQLRGCGGGKLSDEAIREAFERYQKRVEGLTEQFTEDLGRKGAERFGKARAAIPGIRGEFAQMGTMCAVVKDGALDKISGGDRLEQRLEEAVRTPFLVPCLEAGESLAADGEAFRKKLDAEYAAFCRELRATVRKRPDGAAAGFPAETALAGLEDAEGALAGMWLTTGWVAVQVVWDGVKWKGIVATLKKIVLKVAGKTIGKLAATFIAPAADGPIPAGDIIAVGMAVWTVADVYELTHVLPDEIAESLERTADDLQREAVRNMEKSARETADAYVKAGRAVAARADKSVSRSATAAAQPRGPGQVRAGI